MAAQIASTGAPRAAADDVMAWGFPESIATDDGAIDLAGEIVHTEQRVDRFDGVGHADHVAAGTEREPSEGFWPGAPDLAVEVLSPGDRPSEVDEKINAWLSAGELPVIPKRFFIACKSIRFDFV